MQDEMNAKKSRIARRGLASRLSPLLLAPLAFASACMSEDEVPPRPMPPPAVVPVSPNPFAPASRTLTVVLERDGDITKTTVGGTQVDADGLAAAFKQHRAKGAGVEVKIQASNDVPHGEVVRVIDAAKGSGLTAIAIVNKK